MANQSIFCSVNNCHYWGEGNVCCANQILVTADSMSQNLVQQVDAPYAAQITQTPVNMCQESCCKTFVPKNSFDQNLDGVTKE